MKIGKVEGTPEEIRGWIEDNGLGRIRNSVCEVGLITASI
jgi:hypothetical protein